MGGVKKEKSLKILGEKIEKELKASFVKLLEIEVDEIEA